MAKSRGLNMPSYSVETGRQKNRNFLHSVLTRSSKHKHRQIPTKQATQTPTCQYKIPGFPKQFSSLTPFWLRKITTDPHILSHVNTECPVDTQNYKLKVCQSVHHHTIQIYQPTRCNNLSGLLLDVYLRLNMLRASSRPSSGAQQLR